MRVLHIETGRHLYGGALQVRYLLEGLTAKGIENILVCPQGSEIAAAAAPFAVVEEVPMSGEVDPRLLWHLSRIIRRSRPDILHVHSRRGADLWGPLAARLHGVGSVLTRRVDNPEPGWLARVKYRQFFHVVAISDKIHQVLLNEGISEEHSSCIHSAVDIENWQLPRDREWFREEFGIESDKKIVAVIAQLIPRKGHRYLIEAIPKILKKLPNARFLFLGKGPLRDELETLCREKGVTGQVLFAGFRKDLPRIMPCIDLVVHPALMEGLGVSLLQAAACGVPIVGTQAGGIPEIVRDGLNGYLIAPAASSALADAAVAILGNTELSQAMGKNGRELVHRNFSVQAMVNAYREIYLRIPGIPGGKGV